MILADLNNDHHVDIACSLSGPETGALFLGNGDGTFKDPALVADSARANGNSQGFSLADLHNDGSIDWIAARDFIDSIVIRKGDGNGRFVPDTSLFFPHPFDIETGDINGDGILDIVASNLDSVLCFLQDSHGRFSPGNSIHSDHGLVKLLLRDFNHDGFPDLVASDLDSGFVVALSKTSSATGVLRPDRTPSAPVLFQNYPNPLNPNTAISYQLADGGFVTLTVFDILGREVATLVQAMEGPGRHVVQFNASGLSSGVYFCRLVAEPVGGRPTYSSVKKLAVVK